MPAYRIFFPLAGLHAVLVVSLWPFALLWGDGAPLDTSRLGAWHAAELIYGYVPAVLAGFILTALPRWTVKPLAPPLYTLLALWLSGRASGLAELTGGAGEYAWIGCLFPTSLALCIGRYVVATKNRRNAIVVGLLCLLALGAGAQFVGARFGGDAHLGERIGIAAALGLVMVFGGRITPALTDTALTARGSSRRCTKRHLIEAPAALLAVAALACWIAVPDAPINNALVCAAAALAQSLRLAQWRGISVISAPNVFVFHTAYACIPAGFALMGLASFSRMPAQAGIHAWTIGAIALMSLAVMTSMVRRQTRHPFEISRAAYAAYVLAGLATACRTGAAFDTHAAKALLLAAAVSWLAAFILFLAFLWSSLLRRDLATSPCRAPCKCAMSAEDSRCDCR